MDFSSLNWIDWLFWAAIAAGAVFGLLRGLAHELAVLVRMIVALLVTRLAYESVGAWIASAWNWNPGIARFAAVLLLFAAVTLFMWLFFKMLGILMEFRFRGFTERVGGLLVGAVRYAAIFLLLMLALYFAPFSSIQRAIAFDSKVGAACIPWLVDGYNAVAQKALIPTGEVPVGVRLPDSVMPPGAADDTVFPAP